MGVKGRLRDMSIVDIIQIFHAERKTVAINLGSEMGYGKVYMEDGEVVHATYRDQAGVDAMYQLLTWNDGEFEVDPDTPAPERTIKESVDSLMLEGMRRLDETRAIPGKEKRPAGDIESVSLIERLLELGILEKVREG